MTPVSATVILLAAGASRRMGGRDKMLEPVDGVPLVAARAKCCLDSIAETTRVVLPASDILRRQALAGLQIEIVDCIHSVKGLGHSIAAGAQNLQTALAAVLLADLPELTTDDLNTVLRRAIETPARIVRGTSEDGTPGHPVVFKREDFASLGQLQADQGAKDLLSRHKAVTDYVRLPGHRAICDLDTPEDWTRWHQTRKGSPVSR